MIPSSESIKLRMLLLPTVIFAASLLGAMGVMLAPPSSGPVAAVFPPWWGSVRSIIAASAAGSVVRFGAPFVMIVEPNVRSPVVTLQHNGAWFVLNPQFLGGCGNTSQQPARQ